jgi:acylphosphatase
LIDCRKFRISGRVQGVWFRESTSQQANRLGIRGHAVNCPDGTVEVLACGSPAALAALRDWLRQGPPLAEVTSVVELACEEDCPDRFSTGWSS